MGLTLIRRFSVAQSATPKLLLRPSILVTSTAVSANWIDRGFSTEFFVLDGGDVWAQQPAPQDHPWRKMGLPIGGGKYVAHLQRFTDQADTVIRSGVCHHPIAIAIKAHSDPVLNR